MASDTQTKFRIDEVAELAREVVSTIEQANENPPSRVLASDAFESERSHEPTTIETQSQFNCQSRDSTPSSSLMSTSTKISKRKKSKKPEEPEKSKISESDLPAIMATLARLEKEKEGESKTESRSLKQDYKSTKRSERKSMYSCPGEDKCKKVTCTHTRVRKNVEEEQKTKDTQRMIQLIMKKCQSDGYPLSEKYAKYWADKYPGDVDLAVAAAKSDLDKREKDINDAGRINYEYEKHAAMETIGFDTRDAVVDFIEREDWLFKDLDVNGENGHWAQRCNKQKDKDKAKKWYETCKLEAKFRKTREAHYRDFGEKVARGEMTQQYMDDWFKSLDTVHTEGDVKSARAAKGMAKMRADNRETSSYVGESSQVTANSSSASGSTPPPSHLARQTPLMSTGSKAPGPTAVERPTMHSSLSTNIPESTKDKGRGKQAYVEDAPESEDGHNTVPNAVSNSALDAAPDAAPETPESILRGVFGFPVQTEMDMAGVDSFLYNVSILRTHMFDITGIKEAAAIEDVSDKQVIEFFNQRIAAAQKYMEDREKRVGHAYRPTFKKPTGKWKEAVYMLLKKKGQTKRQESGDKTEDQAVPEKNSPVPHEQALKVARSGKGEEGFFKTMAKSRMESKRKEHGTLDDDIYVGEKMTRDALVIKHGGELVKTPEQIKAEEVLVAIKAIEGIELVDAIKAVEAIEAVKNAKAVEASKAVEDRKAAEVVKAGGALGEVNAALKAFERRLTVANGEAGSVSAANRKPFVKVQLAEREGELVWPPRAVNEGDAELEQFLRYEDEDSKKLHDGLLYQQNDVVGGVFMVEDGPSDAESVAFMKEITSITSDHVADLYIGLGARSAALGAHLYGKMEMEVNHYFVEQGVIPGPLDFQNEALRFALWMYRERDLNAEKEDDDAGEDNDGSAAEESEGLYD